MRVVYRAYAKLNLHLDVTGILPNGYHSVAMLMQSADLADTITVEARGKGVDIRCNLPYIPRDRRNIAWKAAAAFFAPGGIPGLKIVLEKKIPSGAGMAGGSADAAAVLAALREIYMPEMSDDELSRIGASVGADVPFCLRGGCCWAEDAGEQLQSLPSLPPVYQFAVAKPDIHINTASAYAMIDAIHLKQPDTNRVYALALRGDWKALFPHCANVFEQAIELPGLAQAKAACGEAGALLTQMTGSGSAVFAVCGEDTNLDQVQESLQELGGNFRTILKPVSKGIEKIS